MIKNLSDCNGKTLCNCLWAFQLCSELINFGNHLSTSRHQRFRTHKWLLTVIVHLKMKTFYNWPCYSKPVSFSSKKQTFWTKLNYSLELSNQTTLAPIDPHCVDKKPSEIPQISYFVFYKRKSHIQVKNDMSWQKCWFWIQLKWLWKPS